VKRVVIHGVRIVVCVTALWWALHGLSWHDVPTVWNRADKRLLLLSLVLFAPSPLLAAFRFYCMLRAQDVRIGVWEGIKLTYAGSFFNFVMVGTTGGDLFKAFYAAQHTRHKVEAVAAVFLDRVAGLVGLVLLATVTMTLRLDDWRIRQLGLWVLVMLAALGAGMIVFFLPGLRERLKLAERLAWLPGLDKIRRLDRAGLRMREHPRIVFATLALTATLQIVAIGSFYVWGLAMGMRPGWPSYYAYISVALVVAAIPITPMGLGTMEAALMAFFLPGGHGTKTQVAFLALGIRLVTLVWALPGMLVPLFGLHRPSAARLAELEAEIADQAGQPGTATA
jgi:uncharacterized membrane protein YbhN (UPF0104 family)